MCCRVGWDGQYLKIYSYIKFSCSNIILQRVRIYPHAIACFMFVPKGALYITELLPLFQQQNWEQLTQQAKKQKNLWQRNKHNIPTNKCNKLRNATNEEMQQKTTAINVTTNQKMQEIKKQTNAILNSPHKLSYEEAYPRPLTALFSGHLLMHSNCIALL